MVGNYSHHSQWVYTFTYTKHRYKNVTHGIVWKWISNLIPHFIMDVITFTSILRSSLSQRVPTIWAMSEERPRNLLDVWLALTRLTRWPAKKSFVHVQKFFHCLAWERVRTCSNAKHVQHLQNGKESHAHHVRRVTTCDKILPHVGHTLMPHI